MFTSSHKAQAKKLLKACEAKGVMISTAESCTGGLIAALLTEIPGSSTVVDRGFVTYSNAAKTKMLGVSAALIKRRGAVSAQVAQAMAEGALKKSEAQLAVAVTGIAGPTGGTKEKPVGLVYIAVAKGKKIVVEEYRFKGSRSSIRLQTMARALALLAVAMVH